MNGTVEPAQRGPGCCGFGCATLFILVIFFAVAFLAGGYWAVRHYGDKYTSAEPVTLPETLTSEEAETIEPAPLPGAAPAVPMARPHAKELEAEYKAFEKAADRNEKARIEFTAGEINTLLQNNKNTRGRVSVAIENDVARVRFSYRIKDVPTLKGRYLNGEVSVRSSPDGNPEKAHIGDVVLANNGVSDAMLDRPFFGLPSVRERVADWLNEQNIETLRIENNRVIAETRGNR